MNVCETMQHWVDESPFGPWWGLVVEAAGDGTAAVRLPHRAELRRLGGVLHGGCAMVVADVAVWIAIIATVEGGERAVTTHLATEYLAPARDCDIVGTARLVKVGRRLVVAAVDTRTISGTLVATHSITYALP